MVTFPRWETTIFGEEFNTCDPNIQIKGFFLISPLGYKVMKFLKKLNKKLNAKQWTEIDEMKSLMLLIILKVNVKTTCHLKYFSKIESMLCLLIFWVLKSYRNKYKLVIDQPEICSEIWITIFCFSALLYYSIYPSSIPDFTY